MPFLLVSQSNSWCFNLMNGLTDWFHTASSDSLFVMLTCYILEIVNRCHLGGIVSRQGMYHLPSPTTSFPHLCHLEGCWWMHFSSEVQWQFLHSILSAISLNPKHMDSLPSLNFLLGHTFHLSGLPWSHIAIHTHGLQSGWLLSQARVAPSRLHFMLWFFKWSLVSGAGVPFSVLCTCTSGKRFSQGQEAAFGMVLFLSQALLFLATWSFSSTSQRIEILM